MRCGGIFCNLKGIEIVQKHVFEYVGKPRLKQLNELDRN